MKAHRLERVAEVVREVASETILFELRDPRVKGVTVTRAEVSGDLLARKIRELIQEPERIQQMAANCARLAPKDAAGRVVTTMEKYTTHEARL